MSFFELYWTMNDAHTLMTLLTMRGKLSASLLFVFLGMGLAGNALAQTTTATPAVPTHLTTIVKGKPMSQAELEARGRALRQVIDAKYKELEAPGGAFYDSPNVKFQFLRRIDVTNLVLPYVSVGMSLKDVGVVFKAAGLYLRQIGPNFPIDSTNTFNDINTGVSGEMTMVADWHWFTTFGVIAMSNSPEGQYATKIKADFQKESH